MPKIVISCPNERFHGKDGFLEEIDATFPVGSGAKERGEGMAKLQRIGPEIKSAFIKHVLTGCPDTPTQTTI